jgi:hypothetical protein
MGSIRRCFVIMVTAGSCLLVAPGLAAAAYGAPASPAGPPASVVAEGGSSVPAALAHGFGVTPKGTRWSGTPKGTRWSVTPTGTRWSTVGFDSFVG